MASLKRMSKKELKLTMEALTEPPLKIIVGGQDKQTFFVNKEVICSFSDFFAAACKKEWACGRANTVTLAEENPETFAIFVSWVLTKSLESAATLQSLPSREDDFHGKDGRRSAIKRGVQLVECLGISESLLCHEFHNAVMDELLTFMDILSDAKESFVICLPQVVKMIYNVSPAGSKLRRLLLDASLWMTIEALNYWLIDHQSDYPREYINDVLSDTFGRLKRHGDCAPRPFTRFACNYHKHPDQPDSYTCTGINMTT
ncbi:hypothetical protein HYFRA_00011033 [Hymenoscyphus fraxineus]|uniref:BTB domain-containing protein n=1 Tax=Hymenoscyphus fraxineus TaxID=746836 RepID=A0A9N9PSR9_9HELO|nr:hypothetical protein HYFRA_00011033 [Hymenoscyphus fraxineus]